ncbi:cupin domain-containing protein [Paenibacillus kobensis]|uniref:cupin domain-containing protein n=1 Tax=Paenibacillus kobensis TaxID=59841 RepID=UPI000FDBFD84|nr:cupin domain-containing protein [Paenibacillus kobensis]
MRKQSEQIVVRKSEQVWVEGIYENTEMIYLWEEADTGRVAFLAKCLPGGSIPLHDHPRREIAFIVDGEVKMNNDILRKGDFLTANDDDHHDVYSETGCTFFIFIDYNSRKQKLVSLVSP